MKIFIVVILVILFGGFIFYLTTKNQPFDCESFSVQDCPSSCEIINGQQPTTCSEDGSCVTGFGFAVSCGNPTKK